MNDITPEPNPEPTVAPPTEPVAATDPVTAEPVSAEPAIAATPEPFTVDAPRTRRFGTPVVGGVIAGVIGLGLGAGVVALANGDDHHGHDRRMSDQQVQTQNPSTQQGGMMPGVQGQQGGSMPGRRGDRHAQQGQQGQQGQGGFFPPNGGGQPQGRSGGS
jgi:hypothetical protein